jgi:hypothetical protein
MQYENTEIPFKRFGSRRALTDEQIIDNSYLYEFIKCFPYAFEYSPSMAVYLFIEPDDYSG